MSCFTKEEAQLNIKLEPHLTPHFPQRSHYFNKNSFLHKQTALAPGIQQPVMPHNPSATLIQEKVSLWQPHSGIRLLHPGLGRPGPSVKQLDQHEVYLHSKNEHSRSPHNPYFHTRDFNTISDPPFEVRYPVDA